VQKAPEQNNSKQSDFDHATGIIAYRFLFALMFDV